MTWFFICLIILLLSLITLACCFILYKMVFSVGKKGVTDPYQIPVGNQFVGYKDTISQLIGKTIKIPFEELYITSYDGLTLYGKYYYQSDNAPYQILFHGYRSTGQRDFCGGLNLALELGYNVIVVDQRAHGKSQGNCLTFGVKERMDCMSWINYVRQRFGSDTKIILVGISMGATTILLAGGEALPSNVVGMIADCGFSSPSKIIKKVMKDRHYPVALLYPLVRLGGKIYAGFDIEKYSTLESLKKCNIPVLFIHGEDDHFVPCQMSCDNFNACASKKQLLTVPGAGHAMSYLVDYNGYKKSVVEFLNGLW